MKATQQTILLFNKRIDELKTLASGAGYSAIRASHNLRELNKLTHEEQIEAFTQWQDEGAIK